MTPVFRVTGSYRYEVVKHEVLRFTGSYQYGVVKHKNGCLNDPGFPCYGVVPVQGRRSSELIVFLQEATTVETTTT